jgi:hypothetical protein
MKYATIEPAEMRVTKVEAENSHELYERLGLGDNTDFGVVMSPHLTGIGIGIIVDGFSLFKPPDQQRYFIINRALYGGNAILYGFEENGESVDLAMVPEVFFLSLAGVEEAIASGRIQRPFMAINDERFWEWPGPAPFDLPKGDSNAV